MIVISKTPMRVSFLGGGTDLPAYSDTSEGAVLTSAVNHYVYIVVSKLTELFTHRLRISYSRTELVNSSAEVEHPIIREALLQTGISSGIEIHSIADIPAGTGFGSSGAFTVSLLHALNAYLGNSVDASHLAEQAAYIEIERLREPIGKQDHYISALGGLQLMTFEPGGRVSSHPISLSSGIKATLFSNLRLFYTGITRRAHTVLSEQSANSSSPAARQVLSALARLAHEGASVLRGASTSEDLRHFGALLDEGWQLKKRLATGVTNEALDSIYAAAKDSGAVGGKLLGAGSGGFFLFYVEPEHQPAVDVALRSLKPVKFDLEDKGSHIAYIAAG